MLLCRELVPALGIGSSLTLSGGTLIGGMSMGGMLRGGMSNVVRFPDGDEGNDGCAELDSSCK